MRVFIILFFLSSFLSLITSATTKMTVQNVIVSIAMEAEATPFIEHLGLEKDDDFFPSHTPFQAFAGKYKDACQVTVITSGKDSVYETGVDNIGTVPAALATFLALSKQPECDILINAGTCGGFKRKGAEIADVFVTTAVANHDRRVPIPSFIPYGIGKLSAGTTTSSSLDPSNIASTLNFKTGVCTTGNSLDKTEEDDKHMVANDASVKDMEAAAIAWSCALHKTPFIGIKVVTDIVDGDIATQDEFLANLQAASKSLQEALPKVLDYICGASTKKDEL